MQSMEAVFNTRMEPIQTNEHYPKYARSGTKPVVRARHIIDQGVISDHPCSNCVELKQDCYRWTSNFSKCAYCTSKDKKKEHCHLPGQDASAVPDRRKRRKITGNVYAPGGGDAASTAGTIPFSSIPIRSVRPTLSLVKGNNLHPAVASPPDASSEATLERVTALENQVSGLGAKVLELLVKLDEVSSCASSSSAPERQAAAGVSPVTTDVTFKELHVQRLADVPLATREWVEGPKTQDALGPVLIASTGEVVEEEEEEEEEKTSSPRSEQTVGHSEG